MQDGRSKLPPPPEEYSDEIMAASLNSYFNGALYRPEDIPNLPQVWLDKMVILFNSKANG